MCVCVCVCIPSLLSLPPHLSPHHTPLGHHRVPRLAPCAIKQLPTSYLTDDSAYVCVCINIYIYISVLLFQFIPPFHRCCFSFFLRPYELYSPWNSPGQNTGVGSLSLLQGIVPTQGSNPGLPHCRRIEPEMLR